MPGVKHDQSNTGRLPQGASTLNCSAMREKHMNWRLVAGLASALLLSGCVGRVVKTVVTAPIKAAGAVVDATTTSQEEADRNRGREIRKEEERDAKARKEAEEEAPETPQR